MTRVFRSRLWSRRLFLRATAIAVSMFVVSVGFGVYQVTGHLSRVEFGLRGWYWDANQASVEAGRLQLALHEFSHATDRQAALAEIELRAGILANWLGNLQRKRYRLQSELEETADFAEIDQVALRTATRDLELAIDALLQGQPRALDDAARLVDEIGAAVRIVNRATHFGMQVRLEALERNAATLTVTLQASAAGLLVSGALLLLLINSNARRLKRALTTQKAVRRRAAKAEATLRVLVDALPVMVSAFDAQGRPILVNDAHERFHGLPPTGTGSEPGAIGLDRADIEALAAARNGVEGIELAERHVVDATGEPRTLLVRIVPVPGSSDEGRSTLRVALDITERKRNDERIRHLAEHDLLTGLPNRARFAAELTRLANEARAQGSSLALHCLDLDRFKEVNDTLGHPTGDQLLVAAAARMKACLREGDLVSRLSGDEFAVVQTDVRSLLEVERLAARLCAELARPFVFDGISIRSGTSVGIALAPQHGLAPETLLQRADIALYASKDRQRGTYTVFENSMEAAVLERRAIERDLREALDAEDLVLLYQPKFDLPDTVPSGCEALLRWTHKSRGPISPSVFVPIAEQAGMMTALSRFVLREVCRQTLRWESEGIAVPVAVNLSAQHFTAGQAADLVQEALQATGACACNLVIEVTEGVFIGDGAAAARDIEALTAMGARVALDDFGTGYSTLGTLRRFRFDEVKIDRSFVEGLREADPKASLMIDAIIRLAHALGAKAVAEGVEQEVELQRLRELRCDQAQGFLLGRPDSPAAIARLFGESRRRSAATLLRSA